MRNDEAGSSQPLAREGTTIDPLVLAAAELFDRLGCEKVRLRDVAARSHVSKNTLYRRYPHKAALLGAVVEAFAREFALHLTAITDRRHEGEVRRMCADVSGGGGVTRPERTPGRSASRRSIPRCSWRLSWTSTVGIRG